MLSKFFKKKKIEQPEMIKLGVMSGVLEIIYIILVSIFMLMAQSLFPDTPSGMIIGVVSFLIVFVFSALISAVIVLGLPLYLAIQKQYKEALTILAYSAATLLVILIIMILGRLFI